VVGRVSEERRQLLHLVSQGPGQDAGHILGQINRRFVDALGVHHRSDCVQEMITKFVCPNPATFR
jgi:hypothetical protein